MDGNLESRKFDEMKHFKMSGWLPPTRFYTHSDCGSRTSLHFSHRLRRHRFDVYYNWEMPIWMERASLSSICRGRIGISITEHRHSSWRHLFPGTAGDLTNTIQRSPAAYDVTLIDDKDRSMSLLIGCVHGIYVVPSLLVWFVYNFLGIYSSSRSEVLRYCGNRKNSRKKAEKRQKKQDKQKTRTEKSRNKDTSSCLKKKPEEKEEEKKPQVGGANIKVSCVEGAR